MERGARRDVGCLRGHSRHTLAYRAKGWTRSPFDWQGEERFRDGGCGSPVVRVCVDFESLTPPSDAVEYVSAQLRQVMRRNGPDGDE